MEGLGDLIYQEPRSLWLFSVCKHIHAYICICIHIYIYVLIDG